MKEKYVQKQVQVNKKKYTLQKMPVKLAFDMRNQFMDLATGETDVNKMYEVALEHIIVQPKVSLDSFDEIWEVDELVAKAIEFQYGKKK